MNLPYCLYYVTTESDSQAEIIAKSLVEKKLIACANIIPKMKSVYQWKGQVEVGHEAVLILKSRKDLKAEIEETLKTLHSYDCPCLLQIDVSDGMPEFLVWMGQQFKS